jgi:hypothetical protein
MTPLGATRKALHAYMDWIVAERCSTIDLFRNRKS